MAWLFIMGFTFLLFILGIIYICKQMQKFGIKNKLIPYLIILIFIILLSLILNYTTAIIIIIHYLVIWLFMDLLFLIIKKIRKQEFKYYLSGMFTIILTTIYIIFGIFNVYNVKKTEYNLSTIKTNNSYKIALISDSHLGTTFDAEGFNKYLKIIEKENPDMLLIAGDFVDDGASKSEMIKACKYLGGIKTKYGVYFVHGNHDKGYYGEKRGYTSADLENELTKNNVKVLKDESILINDEIYLIGRQDFENTNRIDINSLTNSLDKSKYMLVIDHQPTDYQNESKANADLVLSGHTHGGQFIPLNILNPYLSQNNSVYGFKKVNKTNFIVTSGLSDWEIKLKTGCISEYVIINLKSNN